MSKEFGTCIPWPAENVNPYNVPSAWALGQINDSPCQIFGVTSKGSQCYAVSGPVLAGPAFGPSPYWSMYLRANTDDAARLLATQANHAASNVWISSSKCETGLGTRSANTRKVGAQVAGDCLYNLLGNNSVVGVGVAYPTSTVVNC